MNLGYKVVLGPSAKEDIREFKRYLETNTQSLHIVSNWFSSLNETLRRLEFMPGRYGLIPEQSDFRVQIRQLLHFSHRIVFYVEEISKTVYIIRVYHVSRKPLTQENIAEDFLD
jgi:plasmid stabilization system protein ParE